MGAYVFCISRQHKVLFVNERARTWFYPDKNPIGKNFSLEDIDEAVVEKVRQCIDEGSKLQDEEIEIQRPEKKWMIMDSFFYTRERSIKNYVFVLWSAEDKRFSKYKEFNEKAFKSLITLSAGLAHEIKNPLQSLMIHSELLRRRILKKYENLDEEMQEEFVVIDGELKRLNELLENFVNFVRPKKNKKTLNDVAKVIREVVKIFEPLALEGGIHFEFDQKRSFWYLFDENEMKQILINLIKNAVEAKKETDDLHIKIHLKEKRESFSILILDDGVGMDKETLDNILTPFYTTKDKGGGLGMMMTYKMVEGHGGHMFVDSQKGIYTVVELIFPRLSGYIEDHNGRNIFQEQKE